MVAKKSDIRKLKEQLKKNNPSVLKKRSKSKIKESGYKSSQKKPTITWNFDVGQLVIDKSSSEYMIIVRISDYNQRKLYTVINENGDLKYIKPSQLVKIQ